MFSNRLLLWGIAFELAFAAAVIYLPPLQDIFHTASLSAADLLLLAAFPPIVWGSDELRRWIARRRGASPPSCSVGRRAQSQLRHATTRAQAAGPQNERSPGLTAANRCRWARRSG